MISRLASHRATTLLALLGCLSGCTSVPPSAGLGPFGANKATNTLPLSFEAERIAASPNGGKEGMARTSTTGAGTGPGTGKGASAGGATPPAAQQAERAFSYDGESRAEPANLWRHIRDGLALPQPKDPHVLAEPMAFYQEQPRRLQNMTKNARPYLHLIVEEVERRHLPMELALLPAIESSYVATARSPYSAAGIWQFIPATGKTFGLANDRWVDGRRDIIASTDAALQYMERLHKQFNGDWLLAIAAYNSGARTVEEAIQANRVRGKPTDYWSLQASLPEQTRKYIPRLLAFANIVRAPAFYHQTLEPVPNRRYLTQIAVDGKMDIAQLATASGLSEEEFRTLNPAFKKGALPPSGHPVLVPVQQAAGVRGAADRLAERPVPGAPQVAEAADDEETHTKKGTKGAKKGHLAKGKQAEEVEESRGKGKTRWRMVAQGTKGKGGARLVAVADEEAEESPHALPHKAGKHGPEKRGSEKHVTSAKKGDGEKHPGRASKAGKGTGPGKKASSTSSASAKAGTAKVAKAGPAKAGKTAKKDGKVAGKEQVAKLAHVEAHNKKHPVLSMASHR
jgi:soluble lytic murein transglycosylase-like protein